ncbi:1-deoxy-D-xylulose 5-phosphate reductoisomerase [Pseudobythopirellula maris]|uniref:1-deoxy-D-xylulose 5-phosphate reductoisomerase n=1 Tax=Pseudobythopirellula maris TaxID=2527991 RepID=A0A5C5ZLQ9_9BACT|nr:1-deoxy-D-xylulose-5-phosphate reductoisomerase [Pseudobythopirellula maris]TWT88148.1 1-deoxy-D-xylulose 5-phosphate reductoisomerase [Pseudobythopirellula maris]
MPNASSTAGPSNGATDGSKPTESPRRVAVLGATGSIGRNALSVIEASDGRLQAVALSGHRNFDRLVEQAIRLKPRWVVATDAAAAGRHDWSQLPAGTELLKGPKGLEKVAADAGVDVVLAAIVGSTGLASTLAAIGAKKTVALANKETLVMAGPLVRQALGAAACKGHDELLGGGVARLLPVDSEHSAIFQAMRCGGRDEVERVVLTASGGPFRTWSAESLTQVTVDEALAHPTWNMGPKITIDSATMMNKALEIIEAHWLFDLPADKIEVVIHPQSVVHSMVEYVDGSVMAQLGPPDMRLPIQHALEYPHRRSGPAERLDWTQTHRFEFEPADLDRFPALKLGFECAEAGGTSGAVLNAANESAVEAFLEGDLHFTEIVPACRSILESHTFDSDPTLERLVELDRWARQEVQTWACA